MTKRIDVKNMNCRNCNAICCENLSLMILKPVTHAEIEDLKWQLHFDTVKIYIRNKRWYQMVKGRCIYLNQHNKCDIYKRRPARCRQHNPPTCERFGKYYDVMFETPEDFVRYLNKKKKKRAIN